MVLATHGYLRHLYIVIFLSRVIGRVNIGVKLRSCVLIQGAKVVLEVVQGQIALAVVIGSMLARINHFKAFSKIFDLVAHSFNLLQRGFFLV